MLLRSSLLFSSPLYYIINYYCICTPKKEEKRCLSLVCPTSRCLITSSEILVLCFYTVCFLMHEEMPECDTSCLDGSPIAAVAALAGKKFLVNRINSYCYHHIIDHSHVPQANNEKHLLWDVLQILESVL